MALPATDDFTAGDGTALTDYSANWTLCNGNFAINTNAVYANVNNTESGAGWNADAFNDDQYAEGTIANTINAVGTIGVAVRCDDDTPNDEFYGYYGNDKNGGGAWMFKFDDGVWTILGNKGDRFVTNDDIRLEAEGTTITPIKNDVIDASVGGAQVDGTFASGSAGVSGYDDTSGHRLDDWEGGNLAEGFVPRNPSYMFQRPAIV